MEPEPYAPDSPTAPSGGPGGGGMAPGGSGDVTRTHNPTTRPLEDAVSRQELMGMREECADLRAKLYLAEKETSSLQMNLEDRYSVENILRAHIEHLTVSHLPICRHFGPIL